MAKITDKTLRTMFSMHCHGIDSREIADSLSIGYSTTCRFIKAYKEIKDFERTGDASVIVNSYRAYTGNAGCLERVYQYLFGEAIDIEKYIVQAIEKDIQTVEANNATVPEEPEQITIQLDAGHENEIVRLLNEINEKLAMISALIKEG